MAAAAAHRLRCFGVRVAPWLLIAAMAVLAAGTISNQLRINDANTRLAQQAANGQKALTRQCQLFPISKKLYTDALGRRVITAGDYDLIVSTAARVCPQHRP